MLYKLLTSNFINIEDYLNSEGYEIQSIKCSEPFQTKTWDLEEKELKLKEGEIVGSIECWHSDSNRSLIIDFNFSYEISKESKQLISCYYSVDKEDSGENQEQLNKIEKNIKLMNFEREE